MLISVCVYGERILIFVVHMNNFGVVDMNNFGVVV